MQRSTTTMWGHQDSLQLVYNYNLFYQFHVLVYGSYNHSQMGLSQQTDK